MHTRQDKTRQDKDKTRTRQGQDKTRQDKTRQGQDKDKTRQDKTRQDHFHGIELAIILYEHICDDNNNLMILDKTYTY